MTAKTGLTIVVHGIPSNGHADQPGIITKVWQHGPTNAAPQSEALVNAKVFPDCGPVEDRSSLLFYSDTFKAQADGVAVFAVPA